jgi:hypothetical protein
MIMMGFTKEGQLDKKLLADRDQRFKVNTNEIKDNRKDITLPKTDPDANAWEKGHIRQFVITNKADSAAHKH